MKKILLIFAFTVGLSGVEAIDGGQTAHANSCSAKASKLAAQRGGRVLSVRSQGAKCRGVMLVPVPGKPPRRVRFVINK